MQTIVVGALLRKNVRNSILFLDIPFKESWGLFDSTFFIKDADMKPELIEYIKMFEQDTD